MESIKKIVNEHKNKIGMATGLVGGSILGYKLYRQYHDSVSFATPSSIQSSYDFIVIGAGVSGCVMARRLCEHPSRPSVLLVEAGPPDDYTPLSTQVIPTAAQLLQGTKIDWNRYTTSQRESCQAMNDHKSYWPSGKVCGGSSVLNYCMYVRGSKDDFDSWAGDHSCGREWSEKELRPFWKKIENVRGSEERKGGVLHIRRKEAPTNPVTRLFLKGAQASGFVYRPNYNDTRDSANQVGVSRTEFTIDPNGRRHSAFRSYIAPLFDFWGHCKYNLQILPHSQVTRVRSFRGETGQMIASGIEFVYRDDLKRVYSVDVNAHKGGQIILSASAVGTPKLLLLSGIGDSDHLKDVGIECIHHVPGVGMNLSDHPMTHLKCTVPLEMPSVSRDNAHKLKNIFEYLWNGKGPLTGVLEAQIFSHSQTKNDYLKSNPSIKGPDHQFVLAVGGDESRREHRTQSIGRFYNVSRQFWESFWEQNPLNGMDHERACHACAAIVILLHPLSTGHVKLKSSNPFDSVLIDPKYFSHEFDMKSMVEGMQTMVRVFESKPYRKMGCKVIWPQNEQIGSDFHNPRVIEKYLRSLTFTTWHPAGTCRMGDLKKDPMAVVSASDLKVRGFHNLRCIDASIQPHLTSGNPQAVCYLIGEKGAHFVLNEWNQNQS